MRLINKIINILYHFVSFTLFYYQLLIHAYA